MSHFFLFKTFYYLFFTRTRAPTSYAHRLLTALVLRDVQYYIIILSRTFLSFQQFESSRIILILTMILIVYEARIVQYLLMFLNPDSNKGFANFYITNPKEYDMLQKRTVKIFLHKDLFYLFSFRQKLH